MSPLLFLAIAVVVPLLGMIVLGVGARISHQRVTDDDSGSFRRKLAALAPPAAPTASTAGTPGLAPAGRLREAGRPAAELVSGTASSGSPAPSVGGSGVGRPGPQRSGRGRAPKPQGRRNGSQPAPLASAPAAPLQASVRLVERGVSRPLSAEIADGPLASHLEPAPSAPRVAASPPIRAIRRYDRVISPNQRRRPGS